MFKKLFVLAVVFMMAGGSLFAQNIEGKWIAGEEFKEEFKKHNNGEPTDLLVEFEEGRKMAVSLLFLIEEESMSMGLQMRMPGTYTVSDGLYTSNFDKDNIALDITNMDIKDPEIRQYWDSNEQIREMIRSQVLNSLREMFEKEEGEASMASTLKVLLSEMFETFNVEFLPEDKLSITLAGEAFTFERMK